jgi:hypothetical protein
VSSLEYLISLKGRYYFKFGIGSASYKNSKTNYYGYEDTANGYDNDYSYKFYSLGLSTFLTQSNNGSKISFDVDYVIPFSVTGYKKTYLYTKTKEETYYYSYTYITETLVSNEEVDISPFFNMSLNFDLVIAKNVVLGTGFVMGGEDAWKDNWWTIKLGMMF